MHPIRGSFIAAIGVFGDGIQSDDVYQAITVGVVAAIIQLWLSSRRK